MQRSKEIVLYIFSISSLHRSQTAHPKDQGEVLYIFSTSFFPSHRQLPPKEQKKEKSGLYLCSMQKSEQRCVRLEYIKGTNYQRGQFQTLLILKNFDATKMAMIKRNICLHNNLKLEAQKPVVATKEGLIKVNQSTGKKKYLEFSTNIRSSLTGQEWVSTTEEKTEARKSITLEAWFES